MDIYSLRSTFAGSLIRRCRDSQGYWGGGAIIGSALLLLGALGSLHAQEDEKPTPAANLTGSATVSGDFYDFSSQGTIPIGARRPPSLIRFVITPTLTIAGKVSVPFTIAFSTRETSTITPPLQNPSLSGFLQNAASTFSISPKSDWAEFHLGTHTPNFSELSVGNVQLFGLGADLTPGNYHFAASAGSLQRAVEADTVAGTRGAYSRYLYAGTVGYKSAGGDVALTVARVRDDPASIKTIRATLISRPDSLDPLLNDTTFTRHPLMPSPQEEFVTTIATRLPLVEGTTLSMEVAGGLFTQDMLASAIGERAKELNNLMLQRTSSRADVAGKIGVDLGYDNWSLGLSALYIGPGYVTLAYPYLQPDRLEFSVAPRFLIIDSAVTVSGSIGLRTNNLAESNGATTRQIIAAANIDADITEELRLTTTYSNFGVSTDVTNDTLKVKTVAQAFSIGPTWTVTGVDATHTVMANVAIDNYDDFNAITGVGSSNRTLTLLAAYSVSLTAIPLSTDLTGLYLTNDLPTGKLSIQGVTLGVGYRFLEGKILPGLSVSYTSSTLGNETPDGQLGLRLSATWRITQKLRLVASASTTNYTYGSARAGSSFTENLVRTALSWQF